MSSCAQNPKLYDLPQTGLTQYQSVPRREFTGVRDHLILEILEGGLLKGLDLVLANDHCKRYFQQSESVRNSASSSDLFPDSISITLMIGSASKKNVNFYPAIKMQSRSLSGIKMAPNAVMLSSRDRYGFR